MQARLRQLDEQITRPRQERVPSGEPTAPAQGAAAAPLVPAPRRVPVFLRCHPEEGGFAELTITHPVLDSRGEVTTR